MDTPTCRDLDETGHLRLEQRQKELTKHPLVIWTGLAPGDLVSLRAWKDGDFVGTVESRTSDGLEHQSSPRVCGLREAIRSLAVTRQAVLVSRTKAINELKSLIVVAPERLRASLRGRPLATQLAFDREHGKHRVRHSPSPRAFGSGPASSRTSTPNWPASSRSIRPGLPCWPNPVSVRSSPPSC